MARGWESKAVESQQDAATDRIKTAGAPVSRDDANRRSTRTTLQLARARAQADLQRATIAAHRTMLEQAIAELERQLKALE
ncbi:MAG: hypothetical protein AB7K63_04090 [Vicinamibacterales bacterium]